MLMRKVYILCERFSGLKESVVVVNWTFRHRFLRFMYIRGLNNLIYPGQRNITIKIIP
jgi:hypothetical protein